MSPMTSFKFHGKHPIESAQTFDIEKYVKMLSLDVDFLQLKTKRTMPRKVQETNPHQHHETSNELGPNVKFKMSLLCYRTL